VARASPADRRGILQPLTGERWFSLTLYEPADDLRAVIDRHWVVEWDLRERGSHTQEVLPYPCVNMAIEPDLHALYGIPTKRWARELTGAGRVVGTRFRPGGLSVYSDVAAADLTDAVMPLTEVFGAEDGERLTRSVLAVDGVHERIEIIWDFLRERQRPLSRDALLAQRAVDAMRVAPPGTTIADVARDHAVSPRTLQRLFRRYVGVTPKWVLQRYRIHEAGERMLVDPDVDLARLAFELGYADQAHFTNDFRARVGQAPSEYLAGLREG
jgi:AraC-like DNA-binding protein